ncbi:MAG: TAXI family TRAP transporter solute-binding subunit [Roseibium sp.]
MKHLIKTLVTAASISAASFASAETLSIEGGGTASTTGLVPQSFAPYASAAGHDLQVVLGQVLTKSIMKVAAGKLDLAVAPPPAYAAMTRGAGPYAKIANKAKGMSANVRSLFAFQGSTMHPMVWADAGIESWKDIAGKRVFVGPPAGAAARQTQGMIEAASGLKAGDDYEVVKLPWGQASQGFQDGQYDVYVGFYPVGSQTVSEIGLQRQVRILGLPDNTVGTDDWADYEERSGVSAVTIPAGLYGKAVANGESDLGAAATAMMIVAHKDMDDETAYALTKAYFDALPEMKASNALLATQDGSKPLHGVTAKLHPGAKRYYQEMGVEIPENLL